MRCDEARFALSARLDGEAMQSTVAEVDAHLARCSTCRAWLVDAEEVTRAVRLDVAEVPDLTGRILAAVQADLPRVIQGRAVAGSRVRAGMRWMLGGLAGVQLVLAVPALIGSAGEHAHMGREMAAFSIALAVGLLLAATYPEHARVFAPVAVTLVICLASASALDMLQGTVSPARVAAHAIALVQAGLVVLLSRDRPSRPVAA